MTAPETAQRRKFALTLPAWEKSLTAQQKKTRIPVAGSLSALRRIGMTIVRSAFRAAQRVQTRLEEEYRTR